MDTKNTWAPERIYLQREQGEGGSHTWCEDSVSDGDMIEEVEYVRADVATLAPSDAVGAPQGWKLVPVKITEAMHVAAVRTIIRAHGNGDFPPSVWSAMLAAAPVAPAAPETQPSVDEVVALLQRAVCELPASLATDVWQVTPIQVAWVIGMLLKTHRVAPAAVAPSRETIERLFIKHGGPVDSEGWCLNKSGVDDFLAELLAAPTPTVAADAVAPFQQRVQPWMLECFGPEIAADRMERNHRFFEEATEPVQSAWEAWQLACMPAPQSGAQSDEQRKSDATPEGCTPADARKLREANHRLADENHQQAKTIAFLRDQNRRIIDAAERISDNAARTEGDRSPIDGIQNTGAP
jgi:hypothetical protein